MVWFVEQYFNMAETATYIFMESSGVWGRTEPQELALGQPAQEGGPQIFGESAHIVHPAPRQPAWLEERLALGHFLSLPEVGGGS